MQAGGRALGWWLCLVAHPCLTLTPGARQAPLCLGLPRYGHWGGLPCPPPGEPPRSGMEPMSCALAGGLFTIEPPGKPAVVRRPRFPQTASVPSAAGPLPCSRAPPAFWGGCGDTQGVEGSGFLRMLTTASSWLGQYCLR